ncbi:unnamed protein product [Amoebophrya sp. A120]|nr:unnamed protein product [Amoebophrya sp. A120]|eukprot:GSA120T00004038001.1
MQSLEVEVELDELDLPRHGDERYGVDDGALFRHESSERVVVPSPLANHGASSSCSSRYSTIELLCQNAGFDSYYAFFRRLFLHSVLFFAIAIIAIPFLVMDHHSCATTGYLGVISHLFFLLLLYGSILEELRCACRFFDPTEDGGSRSSSPSGGSFSGFFSILSTAVSPGGGGSAYDYLEQLKEYTKDYDEQVEEATVRNFGTTSSTTFVRGGPAAPTSSAQMLEQTSSAFSFATSSTSRFENKSKTSNSSTAELEIDTSTGANKSSTASAATSLATMIGSATRWKESPKAADVLEHELSGGAADARNAAPQGSGKMTKSSAASSRGDVVVVELRPDQESGAAVSTFVPSQSSPPPKRTTSGNLWTSFSNAVLQPITNTLTITFIRCHYITQFCRTCCDYFFFEELLHFFKKNENAILVLKQMTWRLDMYCDILFVLIARNCGSYLWWASLAIFVFVNFLLQFVLQILFFACTDCDQQLPKSTGFFWLDFVVVNKAVLVQLRKTEIMVARQENLGSDSQPQTMQIIAAGSSGGNEIVAPLGLVQSSSSSPSSLSFVDSSKSTNLLSWVQYAIMIEKCFLSDLIQILIQTNFLLDLSTPNNSLVYCSVLFSFVNFLLNFCQIVTGVIWFYRRQRIAEERMKSHLEAIKHDEEAIISSSLGGASATGGGSSTGGTLTATGSTSASTTQNELIPTGRV